MPFSSSIARLFGRSPFRPTQEHMRVVRECAAQLVPFFEALLGGNEARLEECQERIRELEHEADGLKNEIRNHLPKGLLMPVDRRDLLDLLNAQDSIADTAQDVSGLATLLRREIPEPFRGGLLDYVRSNCNAVHQCGKVIEQLDELLELGFRGREVDRVEEMVDQLNRIESGADAKEMELVQLLFDHKDEMSPASFFLWYTLLQELGDIADYAEDVGDRLRLLIAR